MVSTCGGCPEANLAHYTMSILLGSCPPHVPSLQEVALYMSRRLPATAGMAPSDVTIAAPNFVSLSSPSSLANSCTFLVGVWRNIGNLVQFALTKVLNRRRKVLFLVQLKNRRDFSPNSLCLNCNAHGSDGILFIQEERKPGTSKEFQG